VVAAYIAINGYYVTSTHENRHAYVHPSSLKKESFFLTILVTVVIPHTLQSPEPNLIMFKSLIALTLVASAAAFAPASSGFRANTALNNDKVKELIVEQLGVDADKVTPEATFIDDLGADSLDTVELIMAIEEEFDCEIPEEEAAKISKVGEVIDFVESL